MKFPTLMRILAVAALIGQLEPLPAAVACSLRHPARAATCEGHAETSGPSISGTASGGVAAACIALPCAASGSGAVPSLADAAFTTPSHAVATPVQAARLRSFAAAPIPPPPEV